MRPSTDASGDRQGRHSAQTASRPRSRLLTVAWVVLLLLALFPILAAAADLAADRTRGIPTDHRATFSCSWSSSRSRSTGGSGGRGGPAGWCSSPTWAIR